MNFIINKTNENTKRINDLAEILFIHSGICIFDNNTILHYINNEDEAEEGYLNIIKKKPSKNQVKYLNNTFIFNPIDSASSVLSVDGVNILYKRNDAYILGFDIINQINEIIFSDLYYIKEYIFDFAFTEHVISLFKKAYIFYSKEKNLDITLVSDAPNGFNGYFLPSFDVDRLQYYSGIKTIFYIFLKIIGLKKGLTRKYFELKKIYKQDPWNNLIKINEILKSENLRTLFFFLTIKKDRFARRYKPELIKRESIILKEDHQIGIHLSYESGIDRNKIRKEITVFNHQTKKCTLARYHYLHIPDINDYREMEKKGILIDSSVGFTDRCGFKKGFSKPYKIPTTHITEIPVICMDSAFFIAKMKKQNTFENTINEIIKTGGFFTFIFHQSCYNKETFPGFREFFKAMISLRKEKKLYNSDVFKMIEQFNTRITKQGNNYEYQTNSKRRLK